VAVRDPDAALHAAAIRARYYDFDAAQRIAADVAARTDVTDALRRAARDLLDAIAPQVEAPSLTLSFAAPLMPGWWRVLAPDAVRRDLVTQSLRVDAFPSDRAILELPVTAVGDWLHLAVELTVDRTEWAAGVEVALVAPAPPGAELGVGVRALGGGLILRRTQACLLPGSGGPIAGLVQELESADDPAALTLSVDYRASDHAAWCTVADGNGRVLQRGRLPVSGPLPTGPMILTVRHPGGALTPGSEAHWASARIRRIDLRGVRIAAAAPTFVEQGHLRLVEGDAGGALRAYDAAPAPGDASWVIGRVVALTSLGRSVAAVKAARAARSMPEVERALWHLLRIHDAPLAASMVLHELGRRHAGSARWWSVLHAHLEDRRVDQWIAQIPDSSIGAPTGAPERRREIATALYMRGIARWRSGEAAGGEVDLERAVALAAPLVAEARRAGSDSVELREDLSSAYAQLAVIRAAAGDGATAVEHARQALASAVHPDFIRETMAQEPALAPLLAGL